MSARIATLNERAAGILMPAIVVFFSPLGLPKSLPQLQWADLTAARTLKEIRRIAFFDFGALFDAKGHLKPIRDLAPEARAVLTSVEVARGACVPQTPDCPG